MDAPYQKSLCVFVSRGKGGSVIVPQGQISEIYGSQTRLASGKTMPTLTLTNYKTDTEIARARVGSRSVLNAPFPVKCGNRRE